jgi:hypothetical protein
LSGNSIVLLGFSRVDTSFFSCYHKFIITIKYTAKVAAGGLIYMTLGAIM